MKSKHLVTFIVFILLTFNARSQKQDVNAGILGGLNFQNITGKDAGGDKLDNKIVPGFHGGFQVSFPLAMDFYFQPGLLFTTKGSKEDIEFSFSKAENNAATIYIRTSYVEMPLNIMYRTKVGKGYILLGFGPYAAYGVGGKVKIESDFIEQRTYDVKFTNKVSENESDPEERYYLRPLDAGANIFFGYEMPFGLFWQLNSQLGLLKINPEYEGESGSEASLRNTGFGLSAGYRF